MIERQRTEKETEEVERFEKERFEENEIYLRSVNVRDEFIIPGLYKGIVH